MSIMAYMAAMAMFSIFIKEDKLIPYYDCDEYPTKKNKQNPHQLCPMTTIFIDIK